MYTSVYWRFLWMFGRSRCGSCEQFEFCCKREMTYSTRAWQKATQYMYRITHCHYPCLYFTNHVTALAWECFPIHSPYLLQERATILCLQHAIIMTQQCVRIYLSHHTYLSRYQPYAHLLAMATTFSALRNQALVHANWKRNPLQAGKRKHQTNFTCIPWPKCTKTGWTYLIMTTPNE